MASAGGWVSRTRCQPGPLATVELDDGEAIGTSWRLPALFRDRRPALLPPARSAQRRAGEAHAGATVLVSRRADAGTLSDVASKPLFIAGADWPRLARRLQLQQVLRVDAEGRVQVSRALHARLDYVGGEPQALEVLP
nr:hypothetical protein [Candidatus Accumulibacter sp. ACC007]